MRSRRKMERIASWHAYAEGGSNRAADRARVSGDVAAAVLDRLSRSLQFVLPRRSTYPTAVTRCNARALRSGTVYDALHLVTAEVESAELFLTFNVEDFLRLAEPNGPRIVTPPDPPGLPPRERDR
jgi:hypothetical protein